MMIKDIKLNCSFCGFNLLKSNYNEATFYIIIDGELGIICNNCYNKYFNNKIKKCSICGKKMDSAIYFIKSKNNFDVICESCYNKQKGNKI